MSTEHKAYAFAYQPFSRQLKPILEAALASADSRELMDFIERERANLTDPYEGEPLGEDWQELMEFKDAHQYGDFALTRYYSVTADIGLGPSWTRLEGELAAAGMKAAHLVLGFPIGPKQNLFDPGKMGSYFRSEQQVAQDLTAIRSGLIPETHMSQIEAMLAKAVSAGLGLYVTF